MVLARGDQILTPTHVGRQRKAAELADDRLRPLAGAAP
jgi:hypothetical protein